MAKAGEDHGDRVIAAIARHRRDRNTFTTIGRSGVSASSQDLGGAKALSIARLEAGSSRGGWALQAWSRASGWTSLTEMFAGKFTLHGHFWRMSFHFRCPAGVPS
jgi:hypothetical protein